MKVAIVLLAALFLCTGFTAQVLPTKLKVTVSDKAGNVEKGVTVRIYESEEEYTQGVNPLSKGITDEKGCVTFSGLKLIAYYIDANVDGRNNKGEGVLTSALVEGKINKVNTIIE